jgi:hypothetical protein
MNLPWLSSTENWLPSLLLEALYTLDSSLVSQSRQSYNIYSLYSLHTDHAHKTRPLLLRSAYCTENTTHVVPTQRAHWRGDCYLATSYKHSSYCCLFTISLSGNGNNLPIFGQEFVFAGTCLPSCSPATDIHVTLFYTFTYFTYKELYELYVFYSALRHVCNGLHDWKCWSEWVFEMHTLRYSFSAIITRSNKNEHIRINKTHIINTWSSNH